MKRGQLWSAATGSGFGGKPRPVLVLQADAFCLAPNVVVALLTSSGVDEDQHLRPRIEPDAGNGLEGRSLVQIDILTTVPRCKFGMLIGQLSSIDQARVDRALLVYLGFSD